MSISPRVTLGQCVTPNVSVQCCSVVVRPAGWQRTSPGWKLSCVGTVGNWYWLNRVFRRDKSVEDTLVCHAWFTEGVRKTLTWESGDPRNLIHVCGINCELRSALGNRHIWWGERHVAGWSSCAKEVKHNWACLWALPANSALGNPGDDLSPQSQSYLYLSCFGNCWDWCTSSEIKRLSVSNIQWDSSSLRGYCFRKPTAMEFIHSLLLVFLSRENLVQAGQTD